MTLGTTHSFVSYDGNGSTREFNVTFEFHAASDLEVIVVTVASGTESVKALGAEYSVAGGDGGAGNVTMNVAPTAAERLVIRRVSPDQQPDDLRDGGPLAAESLERRLDILAARLQELETDIARALKVTKDSLATNEDLTLNLTGGKGQGLLVANDEQGVVLGAGVTPDDVVVSTKGEELVGLANEVAMRGFLGLGTAATQNTGTSGANVPLLSGTNTHSGRNTFTDQTTFRQDVTLIDEDPGAGAGPALNLQRFSASPAANDVLGQIDFWGRNSVQQAIAYARIRIILEDPTDANEEARFELVNYHDGDPGVRWRINRGIYSPGAIGQDLGVGTINVEGGVYKHGLEYTRGWQHGSVIGTTSGPAIQVLSGLPDNVQDIEIFFAGVRTNTNNQNLVIRLKDSGAIATTGYVSHSLAAATGTAPDYNTNGFHFTEDANSLAANSVSGKITLSLRDPGGQHWFYEGQGGTDGVALVFMSSGRKILGDALQEVWLTTPSGTALFNAGVVRARYR